jgi:uncharacterized Ntn-hydrolase superfamily protein
VDLRVDDHIAPCDELARLLDLHRVYLTESTEEERVPLTADLRDELERLARAAGQPDLLAWVGCENYEMRVDHGPDPRWIDPFVVERLRGTA